MVREEDEVVREEDERVDKEGEEEVRGGAGR